jgi:hypothetical protein
MTEPEPLSAEEEVQIRAWLGDPTRSAPEPTFGRGLAALDVLPRLLATLDAARVAAPSDDTDGDDWAPDDVCDKCGKPWVAAPSDGLREVALEKARLVSQWHGSIGSGPIEELDAELGELGEAVRAALPTTGQPEPFVCRRSDCEGGHCEHRAAAIAAQPEDTRTADPGGLRLDRYGEPPAYCPWCGHLRHDRFDHGCYTNVGGPSPEPCGCDEPFALTPETTAPAINTMVVVTPEATVTGQREGLDAEHETVTEFVWLVERAHGPVYWTWAERGEWTDDPNRAGRWKTRDEAAAEASRIGQGIPVEHGFITRPARTPSHPAR